MTVSLPLDLSTPPADTARPRRSWVRAASLRSMAITVAVLAAAIGLWQLIADTWLSGKHLVAAPSGIVTAVHDHHALYWSALRTTVGEAARGFLWGNLAALLLAALVAVVPVLERVVLRVALVVYCLPLVALGPTLRVIQTGDSPQVTLSALGVYYTTLVPLIVGLRAVPTQWADLVRSYGRGRPAILFYVRVRACIPYLAAGLQVAVPAAILGALVGEFTGADAGLGILTIQAQRSLDTDGLWALAVISAAVAVLGYAAAGWIGRRLSLDHPPLLLAAPPPAGRRRFRGQRTLTSAAGLAATVVLVLGLWQWLIDYFDLNAFFAKGPRDVWRWMITGDGAAGHRHEIFAALRQTLEVVVPGYLAGLLLGVGLAAVFHLSPAIRRAATPAAVALRCVPIVGIAPLLVEALGRGTFGVAVVIALMTFFPTLVNAAQGLRQAPGQVLEYLASYDTPSYQVLWTAELPAMLPAFFAAARIAVPASILAATVAEWLATGTGVGSLMAVTATDNEWSTLWATVVVVTLVAALGYGLVTAAERLVLSRLAPEQVGG